MCFEISEGSGSRGFEKSGFHCKTGPRTVPPGRGGTLLFGLCGDVLLDRVWCFGLEGPKQGVQFDLALS